MDRIALFTSDFSVTWHGLIMALAILSGIICSLLLCKTCGVKKNAVLATVLLSFALSSFMSRTVYWYCSSEQYSGWYNAITSFGKGGESLFGAILGALAAAVIVWRVGLCERLPELLDCMAPGSALAIAIGRLASFYSIDDRGKYTFDDPKLQHFPISLPVESSAGGEVWRMATFFYESVAAAIICAALLVMLNRRFADETKRERCRGSVFMMFAVMLSCSQCVLESTRYDSIYFRSNGFVSVAQIVGMATIIAAAVIFAVRLRKRREGTGLAVSAASVSILLLLSTAGMMEYLVQRHASQFYKYYPIMIIAMLAVNVMCWRLCVMGENDMPTYPKQ